ncbi:MAG: phosphate-starvation-inducible PsiE family protein [Chroococcus sp. CMT-3BRIN-NPC107]|jgi:uncharacterized membrane protein (DUF373 family)|nr:phosphate-starvation-inducible PsiE family protein [Chroococcus sp. CMT-3BRIN-NPC107]
MQTEVKNNPPQLWRKWFKKEQIIHNLELVQNLIVVTLAIGLFLVMVIRLGDLFYSLFIPIDFQSVTSDILFILILVEIFRLLIIYLQEQRISVGVAVEVSIVSVLREVIIRGALDIPWQQILAVCVFLLVLGTLLLIRVWMAQIYVKIETAKKQIVLDEQEFEEKEQFIDRLL